MKTKVSYSEFQVEESLLRSNHQKRLSKKGVLKNFAKFTGKQQGLFF